MNTYLERATAYVRETIRKYNISNPEEIREYFDNELFANNGEFLEEKVPIDEIKARVKADKDHVYEAYMNYTDASYERMWKDFMEENWELFDFCARRYALFLAADNVATEEMEKEEKNMKNNKLLVDIIDVFDDFLETKGIEIPNPEKDDDPNCGTQIYGTDFDNMMEEIREVLATHDINIADDWG